MEELTAFERRVRHASTPRTTSFSPVDEKELQIELKNLVSTEESISRVRDWIMLRISHFESHIAPLVTRYVTAPTVTFPSHLACLYLINDLLFQKSGNDDNVLRGKVMLRTIKSLLSIVINNNDINPTQHSLLTSLISLWNQHCVFSDTESLSQILNEKQFTNEEVLQSFSVGKMADIMMMKHRESYFIPWKDFKSSSSSTKVLDEKVFVEYYNN